MTEPQIVQSSQQPPANEHPERQGTVQANPGETQSKQNSQSPGNSTVSSSFHAANSTINQTTYNYTYINGPSGVAGDHAKHDLPKPENLKRLTALSLYEIVFYLDDSGSMSTIDDGQSATRFQILGNVLKRITSIAARVLPDDSADVQLRFINSVYAYGHNASNVAEVVSRIYPRGNTRIGTTLREKVLRPLVYNKIAKKSDTNSNPLKRPILVCIITGGEPNNEDPLEMQNEILRCRDNLWAAGYEDDTVMFMINQIGQASGADKFLNNLREEVRISQNTYIATDRLDDMFRDMKENDRGLEEWLLRLLMKPLLG